MTFDFSNGDYDFLAGSIDGGDKEEHFTYKITDSNGDQSNPADLTVCIKDVFVDKTPITYDDVASGAEPAPKSVNLLLVFDNSGSMDADFGHSGHDQAEAAKQAAINLLNAYAATGGDVRVMLVTFNSNSDREETWLNLSDAIDAINDIPQSGGSTNYEAAIQDAISGFNDTDGRGDFGNARRLRLLPVGRRAHHRRQRAVTTASPMARWRTGTTCWRTGQPDRPCLCGRPWHRHPGRREQPEPVRVARPDSDTARRTRSSWSTTSTTCRRS